jgi:hypothetical protein
MDHEKKLEELMWGQTTGTGINEETRQQDFD